MNYGLLADLVVMLHLMFIVYALTGAVLYFWRPWLIFLHIPAAIWIVIVEINHWTCPLTPLENRFRYLSNESEYSGDFVVHYILPLIYPAGLTPDIQLLLGIAAFAVNALIYAMIIWHYRRKKTSS